ncbi:unnamed protein product, partial [Rotaria magnacalcarata]
MENLTDVIMKNNTLTTLILTENPSDLAVALEKFVALRQNK